MIRPLKKSDVAGLNHLSPIEWNFDLEQFIAGYLDADYYFAFVMLENEKIIGTGNIFFNGTIGWLANIIVSKKFRGQGLGFKMTKHLVDFLKNKGCETQLLVATALGEPVYKKIGFKKMTDYRSFQSEKEMEFDLPSSIRPLNDSDLGDICKLDAEINDEDRSHLIGKYYKNGLGSFNSKNELLGFLLPDFGRGLVLSKHKQAGIDLLKIKHSKKGRKTLLPIDNQHGIDFFKSSGFKEEVGCSRMILGKQNNWNPKNIYSYGGGYCG
jgi:GNAT superfamily N-acetyltransferase